MRFNRWMALPVAFVLALAIGVVAVSAAPSPSASASPSGKNYAQVFVQKLAGILGLTPAQTTSDLKSAELATIDQMVADGRITKAQGDAMKARVQNGQTPSLGFGFGRGSGRPGFAGRGVLQDVRTAELNALASTLHMSVTDIQAQLRSGKTLSDLEKQQNVSDAAVQSAVRAAAKSVLDKAVTAGTITQQQENALLARVGTMPFSFGHKFGSKPGRPAPGSSGAPTAPAGFFNA
ncbi:MAG TPA: hypothetical protein VET65_04650 [Candidatus Limnocylindrales bacterium]|nr:hypothetical protein [Candidatus Limnocylindrales bacterium]